MLGSKSGVVKNEAYFGGGTGKVWLTQVNCIGNEASLFDCQHNGWGYTFCDHSEDVGIVCEGKHSSLMGRTLGYPGELYRVIGPN